MSSGSRWASIVFALMEWCHFQFWYQPSEALNEGSADSSFAFWRSINPLTAKPIKQMKIHMRIKFKRQKDCLHSLLSQHLKLTNRKRPFPRAGNKLTCACWLKLSGLSKTISTQKWFKLVKSRNYSPCSLCLVNHSSIFWSSSGNFGASHGCILCRHLQFAIE